MRICSLKTIATYVFTFTVIVMVGRRQGETGELLESSSEEPKEIERRGPYERIIPEVIEKPPELNWKPPEELLKHGRRELHVVEPIKPEINENPLEKIQEQEPGNQKRSGLEENDQEPKMKKRDLYIFREAGLGMRMGNVLYSFAAAYGISRHHGRKNLWGTNMKKHLLELFPGLEDHIVFVNHANYTQLAKHVSYDPSVMRSLPETNLTLRWVTNSYRYFNHCSDELYHQMSLRESLVLKARDFINKCKMAFIMDHPNLGADNVSIVGVHIRRGDKLDPKLQGPKYGYRIPEVSEILYAMNYMRLKHNHSVIFIIATDDKSWSRDNIATQPDTFLTPFTSPYDDFTTLASADHLIMTQSSFAWWAAWLLEQRVLHTSNHTKYPDILYNKYPYANNTRIWRNYKRINLYPEHWIGYTNHSMDTQREILCTSTNVTSCFKH